jgi:hypothetical protein
MSQPSKYTADDWPDWAQPLVLVQTIFAKMIVRYGTLWTGRITGADEMLLLRDWGMGLAGYRKEAIVWALENLPADAPPLLGQFKAIVGRAPEPRQQVIEAPKPDPARVASELARMRSAMTERDRLQWAYDLQERESKGDRLTAGQRTAWRDALASESVDTRTVGHHEPIQDDRLPPAMRRYREAA